MVASYLVHHSYCATAEAFAKSTDQAVHEELASIKNRQSEYLNVLAVVNLCMFPWWRWLVLWIGSTEPCWWLRYLNHCVSKQRNNWNMANMKEAASKLNKPVNPSLDWTFSVGLQRSRSWCCQVEWAKPLRPPSSSTQTSWKETQTSSLCSSKTLKNPLNRCKSWIMVTLHSVNTYLKMLYQLFFL